MTIDEVTAEIDRQLKWRGPSGKPQGHIVLTRAAMQILIEYVDHLLDRGKQS